MNPLLAFAMAITDGWRLSTKPKVPASQFEALPGGGTDWTAEVEAGAGSLIRPPARIPLLSRFLLGFAEREFKKQLLPGRLLTWSTDLGIASGMLELFIEKGCAKILEPRLVYILRMQVSYAAGSPYAIDVNSFLYQKHGITEPEIRALQGTSDIGSVASFSRREQAALRYALAMTATPCRFGSALLSELRRLFSHAEIVAIASLAAKVNYWARLIEALRIKPAGYTADPLFRVDEFSSFEPGPPAAT